MPPSIGRRLTPGLVEAFREQCPDARLGIAEGLSAHLVEWIATGRIDLALVHNPEPHDAIELTPLFDERLCLVSQAPRPTRAPRQTRPTAPARVRRAVAAPPPLPLRELPSFPLILPDRGHTIRRLLEAQAAASGLHLDVAWEISSIPAIIDLVALGHGHAVLAASAVAVSGRGEELQVRTLVEPQLTSTLYLARSATKRATPLARHAQAMLVRLAGTLPRG